MTPRWVISRSALSRLLLQACGRPPSSALLALPGIALQASARSLIR